MALLLLQLLTTVGSKRSFNMNIMDMFDASSYPSDRTS